MRAGGLYGAIFVTMEVNEVTQTDHEARKKVGVREQTSGALLSIDGQKEVIQHAQDAEKGGEGSGESGYLGQCLGCKVK